MKIYVRVYATLRRYVPNYDPSRGLEIELEEGATVGDAIRRLNLPVEEIKTVFVNATLRDFSYSLKEGDLIGIFSPIAGGLEHSTAHQTGRREGSLSWTQERRAEAWPRSCGLI
ncbi:MAG: MoaD/ThiS family protein [Candidatus Tectomicrobia bacterium]|uniref:MoaD/ThiS family protein n=1 Tax=Tectimicrobiota bacterium TaxID=2528274 RepID=A0A932CQ80_UNCTE|nr:MoaD/ThiS family protein [Candidatus Tectomicrobia bacterium]